LPTLRAVTHFKLGIIDIKCIKFQLYCQ
jgi:hypothetical protein